MTIFGSDIQEGAVIDLDKPLSANQVLQLQLFRSRFLELFENWLSLVKQGIRLSGGFTNHGNRKVSGSSCGIESHRLKGLYLDFRFFWMKGEKTEFFTISKLLGKHCSDLRLRKALKRNQISWRSVEILEGWHGITADQLISAMFNARLFHSGNFAQVQKLNEIDSLMKQDLAHYFITLSIHHRMSAIGFLDWMIDPIVTSQAQQVRLANYDCRADS